MKNWKLELMRGDPKQSGNGSVGPTGARKVGYSHRGCRLLDVNSDP
jgi:hypothetical protein